MAKKKAAPKKKAARSAKPKPVLTDTVELAGDQQNPRMIGEEAAAGLQNSLDRFGDLSGIVFNETTGQLVCGHQRLTQIREKWGDRPIQLLDAEKRLYGIAIDEGHFFPVRVVAWSLAKQRAANVVANSQHIAGEFTSDLGTYLLEVEAELTAEDPELMDEVLLTDLLAAEIDAEEDAEEEEGGGGVAINESYQVIVQCTDEAHQRKIYDELTGEGLSCKLLTL